MRRYALMILIVGCGGEPMTAQPDGDAPGLDAGTDAGVVLCARDGDCDDDLFCTGQERCRPGEEGADARGCVVIPAPCEAEVCDEAADECSVCSMPDADIDGYDSVACGGGDCDDTRGDVHPGTPEVCDALGVDEDCNPTTLGTDADGDGAYDPACCHQPADGALTCGLDCDDTDDAIGPDAPERCNGVDDDCDEIIDEGFDCIQSQTVSGTNACGREGTRRCSETCEWLDATFTRAESASSCDYCDDSGAGLGEEIPFATEDVMMSVDGGWTDYGDARLRFVIPETWILVDGSNEESALFVPVTVPVGYGTLEINAMARTTANSSEGCTNPTLCDGLNGQWNVMLLKGTATTFLDTTPGAPDYTHLPVADVGLVGSWAFSYQVPFGDLFRTVTTDRISLQEIGGGMLRDIDHATPPEAAQQSGPEGTVKTQVMHVTVTPDDPRTSVDDTTVELYSLGFAVSCSNDGASPCGFSIEPGDELYVGVAARSRGLGDVTVDVPNLQIHANNACMP